MTTKQKLYFPKDASLDGIIGYFVSKKTNKRISKQMILTRLKVELNKLVQGQPEPGFTGDTGLAVCGVPLRQIWVSQPGASAAHRSLHSWVTRTRPRAASRPCIL